MSLSCRDARAGHTSMARLHQSATFVTLNAGLPVHRDRDFLATDMVSRHMRTFVSSVWLLCVKLNTTFEHNKHVTLALKIQNFSFLAPSFLDRSFSLHTGSAHNNHIILAKRFTTSLSRIKWFRNF